MAGLQSKQVPSCFVLLKANQPRSWRQVLATRSLQPYSVSFPWFLNWGSTCPLQRLVRTRTCVTANESRYGDVDPSHVLQLLRTCPYEIPLLSGCSDELAVVTQEGTVRAAFVGTAALSLRKSCRESRQLLKSHVEIMSINEVTISDHALQ